MILWEPLEPDEDYDDELPDDVVCPECGYTGEEGHHFNCPLADDEEDEL